LIKETLTGKYDRAKPTTRGYEDAARLYRELIPDANPPARRRTRPTRTRTR